MNGERQLQFVVFHVAGNACALPAPAVSEILFMAEPMRIAGQPGILEGFMNIRGTAVPAVRIARLFDAPAAEPRIHTPMLLLHAAGGALAIIVESVEELASVAPGDLQPVPQPDSFNGCAQARFTLGSRAVTVLSPDRLLLEKEARCVRDLQAKTQAQLDALTP